jgi:hypothetical protein
MGSSSVMREVTAPTRLQTVSISEASHHRKEERHQLREKLYAVVRDALTNARVLSSRYKFKVLSLDGHGVKYPVMMELAAMLPEDLVRLPKLENAITQQAWNQIRLGLVVTAVYWGTTNNYVTPVVRLDTQPIYQSTGSSGRALSSEEIAAFKKAVAQTPTKLSAPGVSVQPGRRNSSPIKYDNTKIDDRPSPLSGTQYGDL